MVATSLSGRGPTSVYQRCARQRWDATERLRRVGWPEFSGERATAFQAVVATLEAASARRAYLTTLCSRRTGIGFIFGREKVSPIRC